MGLSEGVSAVGSVYGIVKGIGQNRKANQIDKSNPWQQYEIPDQFVQNQRMAQNMAQQGLPSAQYNNVINGIGANQAAALTAFNRGGNPGSLASIVRQSDAATNGLNSQDAMMRLQNQRYAIGQNAALGNQYLAKQQHDRFDRYAQLFNQAQALRGAANANINNGFTGLSGAAKGVDQEAQSGMGLLGSSGGGDSGGGGKSGGGIGSLIGLAGMLI